VDTVKTPGDGRTTGLNATGLITDCPAAYTHTKKSHFMHYAFSIDNSGIATHLFDNNNKKAGLTNVEKI